MSGGFLLDTNVVSEVVKRTRDANAIAWLESQDVRSSYLSVLTIGEVRAGIALSKDEIQRTRYTRWLDFDLVAMYGPRILPIDDRVARAWGAIHASLRGASVPVVDELIAATAAVHGLTVATRNTWDFERCGVATFNPWEFA